jgi:hypothetical protein
MEALNSPLFREMRSRQPFSDNLFRACPLIDHPEQGREIAIQHSKYFTHEGADQFFTDFAQAIDRYAKTYGEVAEAAWKEKKEGQTPQSLSERKKVVGRHG